MFSEKKINNITVKPLVNAITNDPDKIKGGNLISDPYNTTFLCAKRKSGKTSVLAEILTKTTDKRTVFWIFCPTHNVDSSWIEILKILNKKGNQVNVFDSVMDGKSNLLDEIIDGLLEPIDEPKNDNTQMVP